MIASLLKLLASYKALGENAFAQLSDEELHLIPEHESNSIPTLVKHLHGNMLSRWTNFLTEDGEKDWRDRAGEFEVTIKSRKEMIEKWAAGWDCFFSTLDSLEATDLTKTIHIKNKEYGVLEAIHRELAHYSYHIGQIVYLAKIIKGTDWEPLTTPGQNLTPKEEAFVKAGQYSANS